MKITIGKRSICLLLFVNAFIPIENSNTFSLMDFCDIIRAAITNNETTKDTMVVAWTNNKATAVKPLIASAFSINRESSCGSTASLVTIFFQLLIPITKHTNTNPNSPSIPNVPNSCRNSLFAESKEKLQIFNWLNSNGL